MTDRPSVLSRNERVQRNVLDLLLDEHPALLHVDEIIRALSEDPGDPTLADGIEVALHELGAAGLAHRHGPFAFATRTAVRAWALDP
jgi:hypothetical protein